MKVNKRKLEIAMAKSCISAKELQEKAGVGVNTAKAMLSGKSVKPCTFGKICKALGVEVEELIEREV